MCDNKVILLGAGGHAKVVADLVRQNGLMIEGVLEPDSEVGDCWEKYNILGDDQMLLNMPPEQYKLANGVGQLPYSDTRKQLYLRCRQLGFCFPPLMHPAAIVAPGVTVGDGAQIMAGAVIQVAASLGENVVVNTGVQIDHDCVVEDHVHLAPAVVLCGGVSVGEHAYIGSGSVIAQGVEIGAGAVIAAGSVVMDDVPPKCKLVQKKINHLALVDEAEGVS